MSAKYPVSKALSLVLPAGALGASLLLAMSSAQASAARRVPAADPADQPGVAARLHAIRAGVAEIATPATDGSAQVDPIAGGGLVPTWWGNGGWGRSAPGLG